MGKTTSISLDEHFTAFVEQQVADGRYASANEVVREALKLMEEDEQQLEALRVALIEGEESGEAEEFDFDAFIAKMHAEHAQE
jgi:antitoxin ParD1/3/4